MMIGHIHVLTISSKKISRLSFHEIRPCQTGIGRRVSTKSEVNSPVNSQFASGFRAILRVQLFVFTRRCMHVYIYIFTQSYTYIYIHTYICMRIYVHKIRCYIYIYYVYIYSNYISQLRSTYSLVIWNYSTEACCRKPWSSGPSEWPRCASPSKRRRGAGPWASD